MTKVSNKVVLDGETLTIEEVVLVARESAKVVLSKNAQEKISKSRSVVEKILKSDKAYYGINTGFGNFQDVQISEKDLGKLQENLIISHAVGVGEPLPIDVVRAMLLLRINTLCKGFSGIRLKVVLTLIEMLNYEITPVVPEKGSVGASGDLAPLSHMALSLIGKGEVFFKGKRIPTQEAFEECEISKVTLQAKEGLALNNGTQTMTAIGILTLFDAEILVRNCDVAGAMTLEALKGKSSPFHPKIHELRKHLGQTTTAKNIRSLTEGSELIDLVDEDTKTKVQDAYSLRCMPQVHGASRDSFAHVRQVLETEINSVTDNPIILGDEEKIVFSAGNFHGQPIALAMDLLGLAIAELGNISERRTARLVDPKLNFGLPAFLTKEGGLNSGLMITQYTAAALVSENKTLIHPASGDSIPTSANQEDHVSMGTIGARHANEILKNIQNVVAIEVLSANQALSFRKEKPGKLIREVVKLVNSVVPKIDQDREFHKDISSVRELIKNKLF
ncbi:MAG: histidine ammonia-lyase [Calditrichaeota bacterium]|nr:MAG: histidine ammonia-lyase [Calditrichota bacterium]